MEQSPLSIQNQCLSFLLCFSALHLINKIPNYNGIFKPHKITNKNAPKIPFVYFSLQTHSPPMNHRKLLTQSPLAHNFFLSNDGFRAFPPNLVSVLTKADVFP
jgi:hypothetical protein